MIAQTINVHQQTPAAISNHTPMDAQMHQLMYIYIYIYIYVYIYVMVRVDTHVLHVVLFACVDTCFATGAY